MSAKSLLNEISGKKFLASGINYPEFIYGNECCDHYWDYIKSMEFTFVRRVDDAIYKEKVEEFLKDLSEFGIKKEDITPITEYTNSSKYSDLDLMYRKYLSEVNENFKVRAKEALNGI